MIPKVDAKAMARGDAATLAVVRDAATDIGFMVVENTDLSAERVQEVIETYRRFFRLPEEVKQSVDMARTGANRGWGASGSEQVDPKANPDYKQVFDCGYQLPADDPLTAETVYAPNVWPEDADFRRIVQAYYDDALKVAGAVLDGVVRALGRDADYFAQAFAKPMALLRGNYYPQRPDWAGDKDFGIATHTDYGCVTLLAGDGSPGLEVRKRGGGWIPLAVEPGAFAINFGEMLEFWTGGTIVATPHRVVGGTNERISVPMFYNPSFDTNVAPIGAEEVILAGHHLTTRFKETYLHLKTG